MSPHPSSIILCILLFITILLSSCPVYSNNCNEDDKKVLQVLVNELQLTNVPDLDKVSCCCCDLTDDILCDAETGRITGFGVTQITRNFTIPPIIAKLPYLNSILFHKNPGLGGHIPSFLSTMTNLSIILFSWNSFTGPVPDFLGQLINLQDLDLSFNKLSGSIPQSLGMFPNLAYLDLSRNHLSGSIPESLGATKNIQTLILSHNNLTGEIPRSFERNQFDLLDMSRNQLTGDASHLFGVANQMRTLVLSRNQLEFNMSGVVFQESFLVLSLEHNKIYGTLPPQIATVNWVTLNVSYNRLCGRIPSGNWSDNLDEYSFFHNRCLCGAPLPPCE